VKSVKTTSAAVLGAAILIALLWPAAPAAAAPPNSASKSTVPADRLSEAWWAERHAQKLAEVKAGPFELVFIGDSITHGWDGSFRPGPDRVWSAYFGARRALNLGFSGDRTEHVLWRLDHGEADGLAPRAVVLLIGTNNIGHGTHTVAETAAGVAAVCRRVRAKMPRARLILLAVFPRRDKGAEVARKIDELNRLIAPLGREPGIWFVDLNGAMLEPDGSLSRDTMPDLLHPGPIGYVKWAEALEPTLRWIFGPQPNTAVVPHAGIEEDVYAWPLRHEAVLALKSKGPYDLVFVGDSITHFFGGIPQYAAAVGRAVWEEFYGRRRALNLGFGWDRTQQVLWRLDHGELDGVHPKAVVVLIGTNNLSPGRVRVNTDAEIAAGVEAVVGRIRSKAPAAKILLLGLLPRGEAGDFDRLRIARINALLSRLDGARNVAFLDPGGRLLGPEGAFLPGVTSDNLHPTEAGYRILAEAIEPELRHLLEGR
jgi:lysophospholipase L1-like esterase